MPRKYTSKIEYKKEFLHKQIARVESAIVEKKDELDIIRDAVRLCELCLQELSDMKTYIEDIVTHIIQNVFDTPEFSNFELRFENVYKQDKVTFAGNRIVIVKQNGDVVDPTDSEFEGLNNAISVALRWAFIFIIPYLSKICVMDEATRNISVDRQQKLMDMLMSLKDYGVQLQVIAVTHADIEGGATYRFGLKKGVTYIK